MNLKGKNVLVTGAGGFIGSHLSEELVRQGANVRALVHYNSGGSWGNLEFVEKPILSQIEIFSGDVRDPVSVQKAIKNCDVVFHLAALIGIPYSYIAPHSYVDTNVSGTLNVMQASLDEGVEKVVHTSTSEAYGSALYTPIDEKHPLQAQSPYSASKIGADKIAESFHLSHQLPVATIRPFNTFGPRQSSRAVIPTIISQALSKKETLKLGTLSTIRDFNFVKDTVNGFVQVATSDKTIGTLVNIGSGKKVSIAEAVDLILELTGSQSKIALDPSRVRPEKSEVLELLCNAEYAKTLCDWKPKYTLKEGLLETIKFIEKNMNRYKTEMYQV